MQQTTGVATCATHLATDRRALSQAWYSALHLADRAPRARPAAPAHAFATAAAVAARTPRGASEASQGTALRDAARVPRGATLAAHRPRGENNGCGAERRAPNAEHARRIGLAPALRRSPCRTAAFVVSAANGRVHLVVLAGGARVRIVAACAPPLRERVERACAHARIALAGCRLRAEAA